MSLEQKILWTFLYAIGLALAWYFLKLSDSRLKKGKSDPRLRWFFSELKLKILAGLFLLGLVILVVLIWTDQVVIKV